MDNLEQFRAEIDCIDSEMAALFRRRMEAAAQIGVYKAAHGLPVADPVRESEILCRTPDGFDGPLKGLYGTFQRTVIDLSKQYQKRQQAPEAALLPENDTTCDVVIKRGALLRVGELFDLNRRVFIVTDRGVPPQYAHAVATACASPLIFRVPEGEACKTMQTLSSLLEAMIGFEMTRQDCVVAVGGGAVCDLAGFAASVYERGIDHYNVPTTLLAQVDASIGGKTGIDHGGVKNAVGAFSQPCRVLIDPQVLDTLPERQMASGFAEALKIGVTLDPALFSLFEQGAPRDHLDEIIRRAVEQKLRVVAQDEREHGLRRVLNFGHTVGHAVEILRPDLLHGECVALGMLTMCSGSVYEKLLPICEKLRLPTRCSVDRESAAALIRHDKKRAGSEILAVEVPEIGRYDIRPMTVDELAERISRICEGGMTP